VAGSVGTGHESRKRQVLSGHGVEQFFTLSQPGPGVRFYELSIRREHGCEGVGFMLEPGNGYTAASPSTIMGAGWVGHHFKGMA
jgi:hypothetical protein